MIHRSPASNSFEFVAVAALRTHQLRRGCTPRVAGDHKQTTIAQMEIVAGKIEGFRPSPIVDPLVKL
jgi:DNA-directed RNA polymerase subunit K/omega